jgi:hypothetical protein
MSRIPPASFYRIKLGGMHIANTLTGTGNQPLGEEKRNIHERCEYAVIGIPGSYPRTTFQDVSGYNCAISYMEFEHGTDR